MRQRSHQTLVEVQQSLVVLVQKVGLDQVGDEGGEGGLLGEFRRIEFVEQR